MVGWDGVVGASAALDGRISLSRGIIQLSGEIVVCSIEGLKSVALSSPRLLSLLIRHEQTVYAQAQQSAGCFASHHVEERLCGWLLRARDLSGSDDLPFTQEYLGEMLGVRRTSVTGVARSLQETGIIKYARGKIQILDADALHDSACECYESVRQHYERMLGIGKHPYLVRSSTNRDTEQSFPGLITTPNDGNVADCVPVSGNEQTKTTDLATLQGIIALFRYCAPALTEAFCMRGYF
jgi:hypothetical protein